MYTKTYQTLSMYAPELLPLFADRWERFPVAATADRIIARLKIKLVTWIKLDTTAARLIEQAIRNIEKRRAY